MKKHFGGVASRAITVQSLYIAQWYFFFFFFSFSSPPYIIVPVVRVRGAAVVKQGCIAPHERDGQLLKELLHHYCLLIPVLSGQGTAQFLNLFDVFPLNSKPSKPSSDVFPDDESLLSEPPGRLGNPCAFPLYFSIGNSTQHSHWSNILTSQKILYCYFSYGELHPFLGPAHHQDSP